MTLSSDIPGDAARPRRVFGGVLYWLTLGACVLCIIGPVIAMAMPRHNVLDKNHLFAAIFAGDEPAAIWNEVGEGFPGAHFYLQHPWTGDGLTHLGLALLGCTAAAWALLAAAGVYLRQGVYLYAMLCLLVALMVLTAAAGVI